MTQFLPSFIYFFIFSLNYGYEVKVGCDFMTYETCKSRQTHITSSSLILRRTYKSRQTPVTLLHLWAPGMVWWGWIRAVHISRMSKWQGWWCTNVGHGPDQNMSMALGVYEIIVKEDYYCHHQ